MFTFLSEATDIQNHLSQWIWTCRGRTSLYIIVGDLNQFLPFTNVIFLDDSMVEGVCIKQGSVHTNQLGLMGVKNSGRNMCNSSDYKLCRYLTRSGTSVHFRHLGYISNLLRRDDLCTITGILLHRIFSYSGLFQSKDSTFWSSHYRGHISDALTIC